MVELIRAETPKEKLKALKKIVEEKQCASINGIIIDLYTASAILKVYSKLTQPLVKAKYMLLPIERIATVAQEMITFGG